ncbi:uncharacterized protein B4U80_11681, partial [Leptotrombidium deliense]
VLMMCCDLFIDVCVNITVHNVGEIYDRLRSLSLNNDLEPCLKFIENNAQQIVADDIFSKFSVNLVFDLISRDTFSLPEIEVFFALKKWHEMHPNFDFNVLLKHVRWCHISAIQYSSFIRCLNVMSDDDYFQWNSELKNMRTQQTQSVQQNPVQENLICKTETSREEGTQVKKAQSCRNSGSARKTSMWFTPYSKDKYLKTVKNGEQIILCKICQGSFNTVNTVLRHIVTIHQNAKLFGCDKCNERFSRPERLKAHKCKYETTPQEVSSTAMAIEMIESNHSIEPTNNSNGVCLEYTAMANVEGEHNDSLEILNDSDDDIEFIGEYSTLSETGILSVDLEVNEVGDKNACIEKHAEINDLNNSPQTVKLSCNSEKNSADEPSTSNTGNQNCLIEPQNGTLNVHSKRKIITRSPEGFICSV